MQFLLSVTLVRLIQYVLFHFAKNYQHCKILISNSIPFFFREDKGFAGGKVKFTVLFSTAFHGEKYIKFDFPIRNCHRRIMYMNLANSRSILRLNAD